MDMENLDDILDEFENDDLDEFNTDLGLKENIDKTYLDCLKTVFGHLNFRAMQWKVISSVMNEKRDNCTVMATGYGKSLCYQFPSVYLGTVTLVVSPLISLMEDQVLSLTVSNIKACLLGTAQENKSIIEDVYNFEYNLVYVTPEFLTGDYGTEFLKKLSSRLTLIAIDEAHCISKWGHDFRSAFRSLGNIRRIVPNVPILAMTATATENVRKDIIKSLHLKNPLELCTGFDRPNLEFSVREKSKFGIWHDIGTIIQSVRIGSIIVYCLTRTSTEDISEILNTHNVKSTPYHAGLTMKQRKTVHEQFVRDKVQVIVATIAFGMGIDKPDVRMVIHYGASKDLESYYQEVGRAGRDGMPAKCFMFYSNSDWRTHDFLASKTSSQEVLNNRKELAFKMKEYVGTLSCRREFIIKYFEGTIENFHKKTKNCCDNCRNNAVNSGEKLSNKYEDLNDDGLFDFSKDAENFFRSIEIFNGYKGLTTIILFLRGAKRQALGEKYFSHPLFGVGKDRTEEWWKSFAIMMEINLYVHKKQLQINKRFSGGSSSFKPIMAVFELTEKARNWLSNTKTIKILLKPDKIMYKSLKQKKTTFLYDSTNPAAVAANKKLSSTAKLTNINVNKPVDEFKDLLKLLLTIRGNIASTLDVMPYMIISNKALHQLAQKRPVSLDELKAAKLDGLSDIKATKFGPAFIKAISQFKNFLPPDNDLNEKKTLKDYILESPMENTKPPTQTLLRTYDFFASGKTLREISQIRNVTESTVANYINDLIRLGYICTKKELRRLGVVDYHFNIIENFLPHNLATAKLKEIKEKCPPTISYDMIKYILSYNQLREHCKNNNIPFADLNVEHKVETEEENKFNNIGNKEEIPCSSNEQSFQEEINKIPKTIKDIPMPIEATEKIVDSTSWNSDDDYDAEIDYGYLDDQVEKFNNSILSLQSTSSSQNSASATVLDKTNSFEMKNSQGNCTQNKDYVSQVELDLLIEDIKNDEIFNSGKSQESINENTNNNNNNNITENEIGKPCKKRKITLKKEKKLVYLDDSDDSDDNKKSSEIPQKKKFPNWMQNVKK